MINRAHMYKLQTILHLPVERIFKIVQPQGLYRNYKKSDRNYLHREPIEGNSGHSLNINETYHGGL